MIDQMSMIFSDLSTETDASLHEIFSTSIELPFASPLVEIIGDHLQRLHPVRRRFTF